MERSSSSGRAVCSCTQFLEERYFLAMLRFHARSFENKRSVDYCWVLEQLGKWINADKTITDVLVAIFERPTHIHRIIGVNELDSLNPGYLN
jgi:hypothetical protein